MTQDITVETLVAAGIAPTQARQFEDALQFACDRFEINTPARVAGFLAQCRVESEGFTRLEECLYYVTPERIRSVFPNQVASLQQAAQLVRNPRALALAAYSDRLGNGPAASGDGWTYRGRGLVMLTGRNGYSDAATELARPYLEQPDLVAQPADAALVAAWFWRSHHCNELADAGLWDAVTKAINGPAMLQADLRRQYSEEGAREFA